MIKGQNLTTRSISAKVSDLSIELAKAYIKGAVHSFCNNNPEQPFSVRILFGNDNKDWHFTPLQCIYDYYKYEIKSIRPANQAAVDVGWLFKSVLDEDKRTFEFFGKDTGNKYKLVK